MLWLKNVLALQLTVKIRCFLFYLKYRYPCDLQAVALPFVIFDWETMGGEDHEMSLSTL